MDAPINYWYLEHISSGKKLILQSGESTVGRHSTCKVVLPGNEFLSRMHAKLIVNIEDGVVLEQMNSLNGVFINKELLKVNTQRLNDGDRIGLGVEIDEPKIVPPNYAIFILKQMCPKPADVIQISDDEGDDAGNRKIIEEPQLGNENNKVANALDKKTSPEIAQRALHLPILPEVKVEALLHTANDIENVFGEPDEEFLQSVRQINPYVFQKLNNNLLPAETKSICNGDVIELNEDKNKEAVGNGETVVGDADNADAIDDNVVVDGDEDYDENFCMSQAVLQEMKEEMAFEGVELGEDDADQQDDDNLLAPIKMESDISQHFDENTVIIIDDEDEDELFTKVAGWSSKLLSQNIMSQIYPMDNEDNVDIDINKQAAENIPLADLQPTSDAKDANLKSSTSRATLDDKLKSSKTDERKSSSRSTHSKHHKHRHRSKSSDKTAAAPKADKTEDKSSTDRKSSERKRSYSSSTSSSGKAQETTAKETATKSPDSKTESKTKSPSGNSRSPRLMNRSVSCYVDRSAEMFAREIEKPETPLKEKTNRGPALITAPQLPKHRGKLRGVSAESKKLDEILQRQRAKDYQVDMKKKWYQKPKDQKKEYEQNKEKRREHLKKLAEHSKSTTTSTEKSSASLKRKHTSVPKPSNSNRGDFLTKDIETATSSKRNKLDSTAGKEENVSEMAKAMKRRATIDSLAEQPDLRPIQQKQPAERKDAELARNRRTCNRVTFADMNREFELQQERNNKAKRNRRVRFDDNIQIRYIERVEGASNKILNAKDTNKLSLSTYAERREWALAIGKPQNCYDFITGNILSWGNQWLSLRDPNEVAECDVLLPIPSEFNTYKQYKETFVPLMKIELLTTIEREYKIATSTYEVTLDSFSSENSRSRPRYVLVTRCKHKPPKQFDLYTLYSDGNILETFATMPRMRHIAGNIFELIFEILQKDITVEMLKPAKTLIIRPVVDNMRVELGAFSAIYQLGRSPLYRRILQPSENVLSFEKHILKDTEYKGFNKLNDHQIDICLSTWIRLIDDSTPSVTLIQGPPGTGKSVVISNLALQCMYGRSSRKLDRKILICAHSNTAVDNITMYLNRARKCMTHSQFQLLRFGRFDKMDPKAAEVSLEQLLNNEREEKCKRLTTENMANLMHQQEMLKAEIAELKQNNSTHVSYLQQLLQSKERQLRILNERLNPPLTPRELYELSKKFVQRANIVCTTLSSCVKLATYIDYFDVCIIDEATQCTEPWTLLPLQFGVRGLVLVGDTQQLPATVLSQKAIDLGLGHSMFDRIQRNLTHHQNKTGKLHLAHTKVFKLSMQYRMHPEICRWPNSYFYHDQLVNADNTQTLTSPIIPYCVINMSYTRDTHNISSRSISNSEEARFVAKLLTELNKHMPSTRYRYGLITPYSGQCSVLSNVIPSDMKIVPHTVDAYQGQERDVIIISNARTRGAGFLTNYQRLNVAITRPRRCLIICGNFDDLKSVDMWRHLLDDARNRQIYFNLKESDVEDLNRSLISKILVKPIAIANDSSAK